MYNKTINLSTNTKLQEASLLIYNISGQLMTNERINSTNQKFNINKLTKGAYIYVVKGVDKNIKTEKFIII